MSTYFRFCKQGYIQHLDLNRTKGNGLKSQKLLILELVFGFCFFDVLNVFQSDAELSIFVISRL